MELPTVKVVSEEGSALPYMIINETDFDPQIHTLYEEKPATEKSKGKK